MKAWQLTSSKQLIDSPWLRVQENSYLLPNGAQIPKYYISERNDATLCVCCHGEQVILVRQYRPGINQVTLCHPGGRLEANDPSPLSGALRELLEETGYTPQAVQPLGTFAQIPAVSTASVHLFLIDCEAIQTTESCPEQTEDLSTELVSLSKLEELINNGQMNCIACVAASYRALAAIRARSVLKYAE
jgi:8-oxo-dGTP pyrophosphatase MutT (NUDIX family)